MEAHVLEKNIPDSVLPFPERLWDKIKFIFWKIITPFHNPWRDLFIALGILKHDFRQNFVLGVLAPGKKVEDFLKHLEAHGYGNNFIAWKDTDEIASVRKLESFERQYHLRVFRDGEVRGHYEYTPEAHPVWHGNETGFEDRREEFMGLIKEWIMPAEPAAALVPVPISMGVPVGVEE